MLRGVIHTTVKKILLIIVITSSVIHYSLETTTLTSLITISSIVCYSMVSFFGDKTARGLLINEIGHSPLFWVISLCFLLSQVVITGRGHYESYNMAKTIGYIGVFTCTAYLLSVGAYESRTFFWGFIAFIGAVISGMGVLEVLEITDIGLVKTSGWKVPVIGVRATSSVLLDENYFSMFATISYLAGVFKVHRSNSVLFKVWWALIVLICLGGIVLSYSRTGYLAVLVSTIYFIYKSGSKKLAKKFAIAAVSLGVATSVYLYRTSFYVLFQVERLGTGRIELVKNGYSLLVQKPIFGWGIGNVEYALGKAGVSRSSTHNTIVDMGIQAGILGVFSIIFLILTTAYRLGASQDHEYLNVSVSVLICLFIFSQTITITPGGVGYGSVMTVLVIGQILLISNERIVNHG